MFFTGIDTLDAAQKRYRKLCQEYHPDAGGSHDVMAAINAEYADLRELFNTQRQPAHHRQLIVGDAKKYTLIETAKEIRKALKKAFPGIKFSVRCERYPGGQSITVDYNADLDRKIVRAITDQFRRLEKLDPMDDIWTHKYSIHPETGLPVSWGADFVIVRGGCFAGDEK